MSPIAAASPSAPSFDIPRVVWRVFLIAALVGQVLLLANPGYFSHDELQFGANVRVGSLDEVDWQHFGDWESVQFRPLTFDLWLLLSRALFKSPWAMHAAWVAMGTAVGAGLLVLLARLQVAPKVAAVFALAFVLGPYAAYTHGWVATLAELLWTGLALLAANLVLAWGGPRARDRAWVTTVAFGLTVAALCAKEAAVVLPALAALAWLLSGRKREWATATFASAVPVAIYVVLRLGVMLFTPRPEGVDAWSLASIPKQWLAYQAFAVLPSVFEVANTFVVPRRAIIALVLLGVTWGFVARAHWRAAAWWLVGGTLALGPALLLDWGSNQYAYAFSAVVAGALAVAWSKLDRPGRALVVIVGLLTTIHGLQVARTVHRVGTLQSRFSPELAKAVKAAGKDQVVTLRVSRDDWVYRRLTHHIDAYNGVRIGDRVRLVAADDPAPAQYTITKGGGLKKVEAAAAPR
jgi:hypothetical protein